MMLPTGRCGGPLVPLWAVGDCSSGTGRTLLTLELLGGFALRDGAGQPLPLPRKARALLAYLALEGGRPQPRDRLAALLWEDSSEEQARASLRQALASIRRVANASGWLLADGETVAIDPAAILVDAHRFRALAEGEAGAEAEAATLFRGDLLDGLVLAESGFAAWLAAERARLRDVALRVMEAAAAAALAERRIDAALAFGGRLLALDPLHEPGTRLVMRAYAQGGRPAEALRQYRALQATLRRELGVAPEAETVRLRDELAGRRRAPADAGPDAATAETEATRPATPPRPPIGPIRRERRRLAVLSAGIADYAALSVRLDVERLYALIAAWHDLVVAEVERTGGMVHDRMGDTALAVFGRDQARDDDPLRAVTAALAIHRRVSGAAAELGIEFQARVGLAVGVTFLSEGPFEPAIVGPPVTLAATLRSAAGPGTTLVTAEIVAELGGRMHANPAGEGRFAIASGCDKFTPPPLVGRRAELAQLQALLAAAGAGSGLSVCLRGEAGVGKTRLADALAEQAAAAGWRVHRAQLRDFGRLAAHTPRRQLVRSLLDEAGPDDLLRHPLVAQLGEPHLPWLFQLMGTKPPSGLRARQEATTPAQASAARTEAARALVGVATSEAPLLALVEDVHWATPPGLQQLADLSRLAGDRRLLLLMTSRPAPDLLDAGWRAAAGPLVTLDLKPLTRDDSLLLARNIGGSTDEALRVCMARANGNPLFLAQLVAAVRDGAAAETALPGSVQSLALGRMDRLDPIERQALRAAAVLGASCELSRVAALAGMADYRPSAAASGALVMVAGGKLRFVHALIRDAVYSSLLDAERRALHRAAAELYRGEEPDMVAAHLDGAGDPLAPEAYADAAAAALARYRPDKALEAVTRGLALATCAGDRHRLLLAQAAALTRGWQLREAQSAAREAAELAESEDERGQALLAEATALAAAQKATEALTVLDEAARAVAAGGSRGTAGQAEAMARIHAARGHIHFPRGELDACLEAHRQSLAWSKKAGTAMAEAGALVGMAWAHYQRGDFAAAVDEASRCLAMAEDESFERIRLAALRVRAVCRIFTLAHEEGLSDATAAIELAMAHGDAVNELLARTTAGTIHLERWDQKAAIAMVEPALGLGDRMGETGLVAAPMWVLGTALGAAGDPAQAVKVLEEARAHGMGSAAIRFAVPRILGTLAFFTGPAERLALAAEGEAMLASAGVAHSAFGFYGSLVHAALANGEWALSDSCAAGLERFAGPVPPPWADTVLRLARLFSALGRVEADAGGVAAAAALHAEARATPALYWLRPSMRAVELRARAGAQLASREVVGGRGFGRRGDGTA